MRYTVVFALFGVYLAVVAFAVGDFGWLLLWPAVSFLLVGAAYAGLGPGIFGKRPGGTLAWWALLLLLPYLVLTWAVWHLARAFRKEACCHEVAPGVWLGRRPYPRELPPDVTLVVDLTAEFPAHRGVRRGRTYLCLPTLDTGAPEEAAFGDLVRQVAAWRGKVYIHCAAGHGRSALVAAAVLVARGLARDGRQAEEALRKVRPGVRLLKAQRELLGRMGHGPGPTAGESG
jgi:protein-tyrosine phosphatase